MSVECVAYQRRCDRCHKLHKTVCATARRTMTVAKQDGWVRRQVSWTLWHDYCAECVAADESEGR